MKTLEVLFTPAEFAALPQRDLRRTVCVVFDILRATSTMVTALANGAAAVLPVAEIAEALAARAHLPDALLAGERDGFRICADLTGGVAAWTGQLEKGVASTQQTIQTSGKPVFIEFYTPT